MGTIVCRHRNETIFDRLSDNYSRSISINILQVDEDDKVYSNHVEPCRFQANLEWDEDYKTAHLWWYQAKKPGLESPQRVVKDVHINDKMFISLCGYICNTKDYKKTNDKFDVTEVMADIVSRQPEQGHMTYRGDRKIKNNILHFNEIPSHMCFNTYRGRDWTMGVVHQRVTKYWREEVKSRDVKDYQLYGIHCPFVDEGYYENINFYEDDVVWYNPGSKFVQLNHAVTHENFFDKDGYLCNSWNYRYITKEQVDNYKKMFLFLI